jgi:hypothetical protein
MLTKFPADIVFSADKDDVDVLRSSGSHRAKHLWNGGLIPAHGVDGDSNHGIERAPQTDCGPKMLLLDDFDHFAALVVTAARASTMRKLLFMALRAFGHACKGQTIVGATSGGAALGVPPLRIGHRKSFLRNLPGNANSLQR